jgi:glycosyltransferase involved in cell wall biosynthesis
MYKVTLCVPCFERPQRTIRAIECVLNQEFSGWEAYFAGDNCPDLQKLIDSGKAQEYIDLAKKGGNRLAIFNMPIHYGGWGYEQRYTIGKLSESEYTMFMDNDDVIKPNHFQSYYEAIIGTDYDLVYLNTWIDPIENANGVNGKLRDAKLEFGEIGHQEIIVKTSLFKSMPRETSEYGHDWDMIDKMIKSGAKCEKVIKEPTYLIKGLGELRETEID